MKYINELNNILSLLLNEKIFLRYGINHRASYWKIGTSIFNTFERLGKNIKNLDISYPIISTYNEKNLTTQGKNKSYQFLINNVNVTPCKVRDYVSNAAIRQYMAMITSFGLGIVETKFKNFNEFVTKKGEIKLAHNINFLISEENKINLIKKIIIDSFFSNIPDTRNISYSIIIEFLIALKFKFKSLNDENSIFYWKKIKGKYNQKDIKHASLKYDLDTIKKDIKKQGTIATYKEITKKLVEHYKNIDNFVFDIWNEYQNLIDSSENFYDSKIKNQIEQNNIKAKINSEKSKFKNNIFKDRKRKGLIKTESDLYSDLIDLNGSQESLVSKFNESEASHIYDVHKIKKVLLTNRNKNNFKNYIEININYVSDPNNGLMMNHDYHKSFDRGQWTFDANGNMIISYENQKYLFEIKKLKRIKINPKVLNEQMKEFLRKR